MPRRLPLGLLCLSLLCSQLSAQDMHFSQFDHSPLSMNPAYTGLFAADWRATAGLRQQWFSVPVPYTTMVAGFDTRLMRESLKEDVFGVGFQMQYDKAGTTELSHLALMGSMAYAKRLAPSWFLLAGLQFGLGQRRVNTSRMTFDEQYQGDAFDPSIAPMDLANFQRSAVFFPDFGMGTGLRYQKSERTWLNMGLGLFHINQPKQTFLINGQQRLPMRFNVHLQGSAQLSETGDLLVSMMQQYQGPYTENLLGLGWRYHLNRTKGLETALFAQSLYRWSWTTSSDALIVLLGLNYQNWQLGLSYDITISPFARANQRNGGFELSFIYLWHSLPSDPLIKNCPVF